MEIFKATITLLRKLPSGGPSTSIHDRYFANKDDAIQTFKNIVEQESGVSIEAITEEIYDKRIAMKNGAMIAELRVLRLPLYDTARANLDF